MRQVDVLDTTGAGDGFLGGWMHYTVKKGACGGVLPPCTCCGRLLLSCGWWQHIAALCFLSKS